jgi:hypothetical protein
LKRVDACVRRSAHLERVQSGVRGAW